MQQSLLFPFQSHAEGMLQNWKKSGVNGSYYCYHHSAGGSIEDVYRFFKEQKSEMIIMDCIGYDIDMGKKLAKETGKSVILPRSVLVQLTHSLLGL